MLKVSTLIIILFLSSVLSASEQASTIQEQLKSEYGSCYKTFTNKLSDCTAFTCNYPDLSDAKAWKAQAIQGVVDDQCYATYYKYIGQKIVGSPLQCVYNEKIKQNLVDAYRNLFSTDSAVDMADAKQLINHINSSVCRVLEQNK